MGALARLVLLGFVLPELVLRLEVLIAALAPVLALLIMLLFLFHFYLLTVAASTKLSGAAA